MRHYDNMGVAHALRNVRLLWFGLPIKLCTRTLTWDFEKNLIFQAWNDGEEHPPDRYGQEESDTWGGKWEILVIFGENGKYSGENHKNLSFSDEENEFLCVLSLLLRGFSLTDGENTYSWNHHDTTLAKNGRSLNITFGEFLELEPILFSKYLESVPDHQLDEMDRWNVE